MRLYILLAALLCCTPMSCHVAGTQIARNGFQFAHYEGMNPNHVLKGQMQVRNVVNNELFNQREYFMFVEEVQFTRDVIKHGIKNNFDLGRIWKVLKLSYENNRDVEKFKNTFLDVNKILCALVTLLPGKQSYESVPLESIKEPCNQQNTVIATTEYKKERTEFGVHYIIKSALKSKYRGRYLPDIRALASKVNTFLKTDPVVAGGQMISATSKQFMCMIADAMPTLSQYHYFELSKVRGNACSNLSDDAFSKELEDAMIKRTLMEQMRLLIKFGENPCVSPQIRTSGLITC